MYMIVAGVLWAALAAVVPLTEPQRVQLASATDFTGRFDEGALYPLLKNAMQWQAGDETGAIVPDYTAMLHSPHEHRGKLFLIEGLFAGGSVAVRKLSRAGPWDEMLQQWVVVVDPIQDEVAVVYLVRPPPAPRAGVSVRVVGRFYKVLADKDRHGQPTNYLTFVGHSVVVEAGAEQKGARWGVSPMFGALLLLAGGWYVLRRTLRAKPTQHQLRLREIQQRSEIDSVESGVPEVELSQDTAEALQMMQQLRQESE